MADPVTATIGAVGLAGSAIGGIVSGIGAKESGDASAAAYRYKAGVAMLNKQINDQNAVFAREAGGIKGMEEGLRAGQEISQTKAMQGASGIDVNTGSAVGVRDTQTKVSQFDQQVIEWDAEKTAYGYETKAATDVAESNLDLFAADSAKRAGTIAEIGSFLSGASSVSSKWLQGKSTGVF